MLPSTSLSYAKTKGAIRSPQWRYDRAARLVNDGRPPHPRRDDRYIAAFRKYLLVQRELRRKLDYADDVNDALSDRYEHLWNAETIFSSGEENRLRYELEALILARVPFEEIADRLAIDVATVQSYERIFFHVTDKLDSRAFIVYNVIGPTFMAGLGNRTAASTAKYFAYFAGRHVLDMILDAFGENPIVPENPSEVGDWVSSTYRSRFGLSSLVSVTFLEPTSYTSRTLLEGYYNLLSLSSREKAGDGDNNSINAAFEIFAKQNPALIGSKADSALARHPGGVRSASLEPRVAELMGTVEGKVQKRFIEKYNSPDWVPPDKRKSTELIKGKTEP